MGTAKKAKAFAPEELRAKLHSIVRKARTIVLLCHGEAGRIVGRPMANVRTDDDSTVYLVTGADTRKVEELRANPRVTLAVEDHAGYAMIDGEVRVSQDRALIDELWTDGWKVWFESKDDPNIAILIVEPLEGTFWDLDLGHGLSFLWRMVKARLTSDKYERAPGDQETVDLSKH